VHAPATQLDVAFCSAHTTLHAPQLFESEATCTSQPSTSLPLQLLKPAGQGVQTLGDPVHA
jgi:hypothetical protein